jgi:hypothetical protein
VASVPRSRWSLSCPFSIAERSSSSVTVSSSGDSRELSASKDSICRSRHRWTVVGTVVKCPWASMT